MLMYKYCDKKCVLQGHACQCTSYNFDEISSGYVNNCGT